MFNVNLLKMMLFGKLLLSHLQVAHAYSLLSVSHYIQGTSDPLIFIYLIVNIIQLTHVLFIMWQLTFGEAKIW